MSICSKTALLVAALLLIVLTVAPAAAAHTVARGLADIGLADAGVTHDDRVQIMDDYARLRVRYLKLMVEWPRAEPAQGVYDENYLAAFDDIATLAQERRIKLTLTVVSTPRWASDPDLWSSPPYSMFKRGEYYSFYAPAREHVADFGAFATTLSGRAGLVGKVFAYECWNEPNLWVWLFPQVRSAGDDFAVKRYAQLLKAFHDGVTVGDPQALVIAGATAPIGNVERARTRTTPQHFARALKSALKALDGQPYGAYFDAYSHHPYTPGGSFKTAPEALPSVPSTTVQLRNLSTLLDVFPNTPFYLTEYGYNTSTSGMFGGLPLSQATQADYLRRAYSYAGRYAQVKALFWYLRRDQSPSGVSSDTNGVYTGLRTVNDTRKRSWYTFAGGNRLTLEAPSSIRKGQTATLHGVLTSSRLGTSVTGLTDKNLTLQRCFSGHWRSLKKTVTTGNAGAFHRGVSPTSSGRYRVVWVGVTTSPDRWITVR